MKIKAKIPFTYMYPAPEPPEPVVEETLYWFAGTVTIETDGGYGYPNYETSEGDFWGNAELQETVNIVWDGTLYENVPNAGGRVGESGSFANYPFYIVNDDGGVQTYAETAGDHTLKLVAGEYIVNTLTIKNDETSASGIWPGFNSVTENKVILPNNDVSEAIAPGASVTENVVYYTNDPEYPAALAYTYGAEKTGGNALYDDNGNITLPEGVTTGNIVLKK